MITEAERKESDERFARAQRDAFNRAADLNVTQIMERIGSLEVSVNNLQNNLMASIVKVLSEQQEAAADRAELQARLSQLEASTVAVIRQQNEQMLSGRDQTVTGLAWMLLSMIVLAVGYVVWGGIRLIGG
jgi:hypothetical protein